MKISVDHSQVDNSNWAIVFGKPRGAPWPLVAVLEALIAPDVVKGIIRKMHSVVGTAVIRATAADENMFDCSMRTSA